MLFNVVTSTNFDNKILFVEFKNTNKNNALSLKMLDELISILSKKKLLHQYQAIVFKGHDDSTFSAGADLNDIKFLKKNKNLNSYHKKLNTVLNKLKEIKVIKVSVIKNFCIGAGFIFAMYTDICIANRNCLFSIPASKLNISLPKVQLDFLLKKFPKNQLLKEAIFTGRKFSTSEAYNSNLINIIFSEKNFKRSYLEYLAELTNSDVKVKKYYFSKLYS